MVLQSHVFSGQAQVGFGNAGLDDHLFEELGVDLPTRGRDTVTDDPVTGHKYISNMLFPASEIGFKFNKTRKPCRLFLLPSPGDTDSQHVSFS